MALPFPQMLGSGHGGILEVLHAGFDLPFLAGLIVAKIVGSAVSIGAGFRGGLFSSSLFLGALFGDFVGELADAARAAPRRRPADLRTRRHGGGRRGDRRRADDDDHAGVRDDRRLFRRRSGSWSASSPRRSRCGIGSAIPLRPGASICAGLRSAARRMSAGLTSCLIGPMMRRDPAVISADLSLDELHRRYPAGSDQAGVRRRRRRSAVGHRRSG